MKTLAIADGLIPEAYIRDGFASTPDLAEGLVIRTWSHRSVDDLQRDNLAVEQGGPEAIDIDPELFAGIEDFDVLVTQFCPVPRAVIERAASLKAIGVMRGGTENVDGAAAEEHGVRVINAPGRNAEAVAEFTLGLMLAETRNISRSEAELRSGQWDRDFPDGDAIPEIEGKTVAIIGYGQIGRRVAKFVRAMGASVVAYDPWAKEVDEGVELVDELVDAVRRADVLTIHARLTPGTRHLVSREIIGAMKPTSFLINSARSGLVDEGALLDALEQHRIAGAAIDTFDEEPLPASSRFVSLPNVTITGHLAGSTIDAFRKTPRLLAQRLVDALSGE